MMADYYVLYTHLESDAEHARRVATSQHNATVLVLLYCTYSTLLGILTGHVVGQLVLYRRAVAGRLMRTTTEATAVG